MFRYKILSLTILRISWPTFFTEFWLEWYQIFRQISFHHVHTDMILVYADTIRPDWLVGIGTVKILKSFSLPRTSWPTLFKSSSMSFHTHMICSHNPFKYMYNFYHFHYWVHLYFMINWIILSPMLPNIQKYKLSYVHVHKLTQSGSGVGLSTKSYIFLPSIRKAYLKGT